MARERVMGRKPTGRPTSFDIAYAAGVSQPTVSRALRGDRSVSATTRARIEQIAMQLGYRDTACFRSAFKSLTGLSPRAWRNSRAADPATAKV